MPHTLRTNRLILRPPTLRDAAPFARAVNNLDVVRNTGTWDYPVTHAYTAFRFSKSMTSDPTESQNFVIQAGSDVIGLCGVGFVSRGRYEIGYMMGKPWWGKGLMSEVVRHLSAHAFKTMPMQSIVGGVYADNPASSRVLLKNGFVKLGPSDPVWSVARRRADPGIDYILTRERQKR